MHKFARIIDLPGGKQVLLMQGENSSGQGGLKITTAVQSKISGDQHIASMHIVIPPMDDAAFAAHLDELTVEDAIRLRDHIVGTFHGMF